jgi:hypothetical protein
MCSASTNIFGLATFSQTVLADFQNTKFEKLISLSIGGSLDCF